MVRRTALFILALWCFAPLAAFAADQCFPAGTTIQGDQSVVYTNSAGQVCIKSAPTSQTTIPAPAACTKTCQPPQWLNYSTCTCVTPTPAPSTQTSPTVPASCTKTCTAPQILDASTCTCSYSPPTTGPTGTANICKNPGEQPATAADLPFMKSQGYPDSVIYVGSCWNASDPNTGRDAGQAKQTLEGMKCNSGVNTAQLDGKFAVCAAKFMTELRTVQPQACINSAYRSPEKQAATCRSICGDTSCPGRCAPPGASYHQKGLAIDIESKNYSQMWAIANKHGLRNPTSLHSSDPVHIQPIGGTTNCSGTGIPSGDSYDYFGGGSTWPQQQSSSLSTLTSGLAGLVRGLFGMQQQEPAPYTQAQSSPNYAQPANPYTADQSGYYTGTSSFSDGYNYQSQSDGGYYSGGNNNFGIQPSSYVDTNNDGVPDTFVSEDQTQGSENGNTNTIQTGSISDTVSMSDSDTGLVDTFSDVEANNDNTIDSFVTPGTQDTGDTGILASFEKTIRNLTKNIGGVNVDIPDTSGTYKGQAGNKTLAGGPGYTTGTHINPPGKATTGNVDLEQTKYAQKETFEEQKNSGVSGGKSMVGSGVNAQRSSSEFMNYQGEKQSSVYAFFVWFTKLIQPFRGVNPHAPREAVLLT